MNWQGDITMFGHTTCAQCNKVIHTDLALVKVVYVGHSTVQEHFCSQSCHHSWYLDRLKSLGM